MFVLPSVRHACVFALFLAAGSWAATAGAVTYTTLPDAPGENGLTALGISGSDIVGSYRQSVPGGYQVGPGFIYNGSTYTTLSAPQGFVASANAISGGIVVGELDNATEHGYIYNGSTYTLLDDPSAVYGTVAEGVSGNNVVGWYRDSSATYHGFLFNGSTYTNVDVPGASFNIATGISGSDIVGYYSDTAGEHGFLYNGSTFTTLNDPLGAVGTVPRGISGGVIVGSYEDASSNFHGFVYDGTTYTTLDDPASVPNAGSGTEVLGITGTTVVGSYTDASGLIHGFVADLSPTPEPSTLVLLSIAALGLLGYARRRRAKT